MTTIIDPTGTPEIVYNRSGVTIVEMAVPSGSAVEIPHVSGVTVALVVADNTGTTPEVHLPISAAEIGDVVEVYRYGDDNFVVKKVTGATYLGPELSVNDTNSGIFRKVSSTEWRKA